MLKKLIIEYVTMIKKQYLTYCVVAPKWHRHYTRTDLIKRDDHFTTVLEKNEFSESQFFQPWYKQSHPVPCLEKAKVLWDIPWHLEKFPRNGANKPDVNVLDKMNKEWFIIEGTTCMPRTIPARTMFKRDEY